MTDDYNPKTLDEMREIARAIHPQARPLLVDGHWEIKIATEYEQSYVLPARFDGTPAAVAYASVSNGQDALHEWIEHSDYRGLPLEVAAEHFNIITAYAEAFHRRRAILLAERGLPTEEELFKDWSAITEEQYAGIKASRAAAEAELAPIYEAQHEAVTDAYYGEV